MAPSEPEEVPVEGAEGPLTRRRPELRPLPRSFYARPALRLARDLLGRLVVREAGGELMAGRIVETEAYRPDDPASHSFGGPSARNATMFGPPGHAYVYRSYGIHACMNVVAGRGSAVLLRALEPLEGLGQMSRRRGLGDPRLMCAGPGRLCQALGIWLDDDGHDLTRGRELWLAAGRPLRRAVRAPRIGIATAVESPWRFVEPGSRFLSRPAPRAVTARGRASSPRSSR